MRDRALQHDRALRRLYVATFLYSFSQALGVPLLPEHLKLTFGASLRFIGIVMGLYGVMQIALRLPMGDMADRRGRKPSLVIAFVATIASSLFFAFGPTQWWSVPGVLLFGFAGGVFWVAANSYLFDRADDVAKATSDYTIAMSLAFLVGPPIGHFVADRYGFGAAFLLTVATNVAGLAITMMLPEVKPAPRPAPPGSSYARAWRLLAHPALVLSAFGTFAYSMLFATQQSFFQLHALAVGLSVAVVGLLLGGRQATALLVRAGLPRLLGRIGPSRVMVGGIVVLALTLFAVPFATTLWALVAVMGVAGLATGALIPANLMLVHEGAPTGQRGLANGIYGTMLGLGNAVAPFLFGAIGARYGLGWTFWAAALTGLALAGAIVVFQARRVQRTGRPDGSEAPK
ncbi:MAG TPA: MFS transporter [Candidatus Thermoplasmatota archaeon]|nr:MFS transporter [Candidatus Thermoplasmatota archaeon]